jgi:hypothetical protein
MLLRKMDPSAGLREVRERVARLLAAVHGYETKMITPMCIN